MRHTIGIILAVTLSVSLAAQDQAAPPRFEVISIKSATSVPTGVGPQAPDVFSFPFGTAHQLVAIAYGLPAYRVIGGFAWTRSDRFQVLAKAATPIAGGQRRVMVQGLLAERLTGAVVKVGILLGGFFLWLKEGRR